MIPEPKIIGYDIGCAFKKTASKAINNLSARFVIPSMHGYAHNRPCQIDHHPKYVAGAGIEDFETCERFFSNSNNCAGITRYTTHFHRHQLLDLHFRDSDQAHFLSSGKFIYKNYSDALERITQLTKTFFLVGAEDDVRNGTYEGYLRAEANLLSRLRLEPYDEQSRFKYVELLEAFWLAEAEYGQASRKCKRKASSIPVLALTQGLPPVLAEALRVYNETSGKAQVLEGFLGIQTRWTPDSPEYIEASKWAKERKYRLALDRLERLVIQRLFELQKANLVSTGKFLVFQCGIQLITIL